MTQGGHRRILSSAVDAYLATRTKLHEGALSPRQAGVEARLYEHPDDHYKNAIREEDAERNALSEHLSRVTTPPRS